MTGRGWVPAGDLDRRGRSRNLAVGDVVGYAHAAWEVTHTSPIDPPTPGGHTTRVTFRRLHGPKHPTENDAGDMAARVIDPLWRSGLHVFREGRVYLCSCCGHPAPCQTQLQTEAAAAAMKRAEHELKLMPGCCPACQEPVTTRQRTIDFPGPNVRNPLAAENPVFHLRRKCYAGAASYEDVWVAADPANRRRSLLTIRCAGTVVVHAGGEGECFGAVDSDCPSIYARHRAYTACYMQSHGCPRGCSHQHGTRVAGRPDHPRDLHGAAS